MCVLAMNGSQRRGHQPPAAQQEEDGERSDVAEDRHGKQQQVGDGVGAVLEGIVAMETGRQRNRGVVASVSHGSV